MRGMLQERGYDATWQVGSAGTWTVHGEPASWYGQAAMEEQGCDTSRHRSLHLEITVTCYQPGTPATGP